MNIILFDDDENLCKYCRTLINEYGYNLSFVTSLPNEIKRYMCKHPEPALFLIDIMIGTNQIGLALAEDIKKENKNNMIVFITGYPDMILYNTRAKALADIVILKTKEYFKSELIEALEIANTLFNEKAFFHYHTRFTGYGMVALNDIYYFEKVKGRNTIHIHHRKGNTIIHHTFLQIMTQLDNRFVRCHNSYIANTDEICGLNRNNKMVLLKDKRFCYYSRGHKKELEECLQSK